MLKADFLRVAHLVTLSTIKTKTEHDTEKRRVVNKFLTYEVVNNSPNPHFSISKPLNLSRYMIVCDKKKSCPGEIVTNADNKSLFF